MLPCRLPRLINSRPLRYQRSGAGSALSHFRDSSKDLPRAIWAEPGPPGPDHLTAGRVRPWPRPVVPSFYARRVSARCRVSRRSASTWPMKCCRYGTPSSSRPTIRTRPSPTGRLPGPAGSRSAGTCASAPRPWPDGGCSIWHRAPGCARSRRCVPARPRLPAPTSMPSPPRRSSSTPVPTAAG